ncbi:hypothetical protein E2C01_056867 [Portunus trituberculatus]|uniref:Uncharacterized protein n=1 Tax=Portunus trituberculatus TaxID=210409 RepID=A0A5B7H0B3_PORTR|nr:hypothetical protein [Portunus trituberculatus]
MHAFALQSGNLAPPCPRSPVPLQHSVRGRIVVLISRRCLSLDLAWTPAAARSGGRGGAGLEVSRLRGTLAVPGGLKNTGV